MCKPVKDGEGQEALKDCGSCGCSLSEASSRGPHNGPRVSFREKEPGPYNTYRVGQPVAPAQLCSRRVECTDEYSPCRYTWWQGL